MKELWFERDGVQLHAVTDGPEDGPLYMLLHGFPEFWYGWRYQIPVLAAAGYRVLAPDGRGYNLSGKPSEVKAYRMEELAADVLAIADQLGYRKMRLAGHDWGAAVAWYLALRYPERIEHLTILNVPHPAVLMRRLRRDPRQMLRSWYMAYFQLPWLPEAGFRAFNYRSCTQALIRTSRPGTFSPEDLERYREAWRQPGAVTGMINWYRALFRYRPALGTPTVQPPTSILWGVKDKFIGSDLAQESLGHCREGKLTFFEEATHWVQLEEPEKVSQLLI